MLDSFYVVWVGHGTVGKSIAWSWHVDRFGGLIASVVEYVIGLKRVGFGLAFPSRRLFDVAWILHCILGEMLINYYFISRMQNAVTEHSASRYRLLL